MRLTATIGDKEITITTEHSASSYGIPVVLVDGEITDAQVEYESDEPEERSLLDQLADIEAIWYGPQTRRALHALAEEMLGETPSLAAYQGLFAEFERRGQKLRQAEES